MHDPDCLFCGIVKGDFPATVIYEDERTLAFMDINPATRGHCLVVPKAHAADIVEADPDDVAACSLTAKLLADRALERLGADGAAVVSFCRAAAGQTVFHLHFHVVPRYEGDGLQLPWIPQPGDPSEIASAAKELIG
ncbi:MAG: HIT family protein [Solirubrobacterales bacterium]|nr:HIT family protein [Solirubrobacterales bacterium]